MSKLPRATVIQVGQHFMLWIELREFIYDVLRAREELSRELPRRIYLVGHAWERG